MTDHVPAGILSLVRDGWRRVAAAPAIWLGAWLVTLAITVPPALALRAVIEDDLGHSASGARAAAHVDYPWWQEFEDRHPQEAATFAPTVIGFAAVVRDVSGFVDGSGLATGTMAVAALYGAAWIFLLGGILDRYARRRRVGTAAFFGACGTFFWRFLRLGVLAALVYGVLFGVVHGWLFDRLYPWLTRDLSVERTAFLVRLVLYALFLPLVALAAVLFDLAKARAVVEDRRSMLGALLAGARLLRRHPAACAGAFAMNGLVFAGVLAAYAILAPGVGTAGLVSLGYALLVGQAFIAARIGVKLAFYATAVALAQDRLAHAGYTAAPVPVWPDSPAAESVAN